MAAVRKKLEKSFLYVLFFATASALPALLRKPPKHEWAFAYIWNAATNILLDKIAVKKGWVAYPTRLFPRLFSIHVLFDTLLYPTATVIYNQMTYKEKFLPSLYKVFFFSIPLTAIEIWADRYTGLIRWGTAWKWYHSLISVSVKSWWTRGAVEMYGRWWKRNGRRSDAKLQGR